MEKRENSGIIFDSTMAGLLERSSNLQLLQKEGINTSSLIEQTDKQIQTVVDSAKLQALRKELKEL